MKDVALSQTSKIYFGLSSFCWPGILFSFLDSTFGGVIFFLPLYFNNILHFKTSLSGILIAVYGVGTAFGGLIGGSISDRTSPELVLAISLLLQGFVFLILLQLDSVFFIACVLFIFGAAANAFLTSNTLWVLNRCNGSNKLRAVSLLSSASNLGIGVSAVIVTYISTYGFEYLFFSGSIIFIISSLYLFFFERIKVLPHLITDINFLGHPKICDKSPNRRILFITLSCLFFTGIIVAQLSTTYCVYIKSSFPGLGYKALGILFAINSLLIICFQESTVKLFENNKKILVLGIGAFLIGIGMLMLAFAVFYILVVFACIIYTFGEILFFSTAQILCYDNSPKKKQGRHFGMYRTTYAVSLILGPLVGGFSYDYLSTDLVWYMSGFIGIVCLFFCIKNQNL